MHRGHERHQERHPLRRRAHAAGRRRRAGGGRAFSRRDRGLRAGRGGAPARAARRRAARRCVVHGGAILSSAADADRVVTGGDDGKVVSTDAKGESTVLAADAKHRWIDHVAVGPSGAVAWSAGRAGLRPHRQRRRAHARGALDRRRTGVRAEGPSPRHRALQRRHALVSQRPERARNAGMEGLASRRERSARTGGSWSPPCRSRRLHGWRLADRKDMRMSGYGARVRSLDWTADGKWLATSGSTQLILWPFQGKDGPMGKTPRILAPVGAAGRGRRLPSQAGGGGGRLCRRPRSAGARRRRRRDPGAQGGRRADHARSPGARPAGMLAFGTEERRGRHRRSRMTRGTISSARRPSAPRACRARCRAAGSTPGCGRTAKCRDSRAPRACGRRD